MHLPW